MFSVVHVWFPSSWSAPLDDVLSLLCFVFPAPAPPLSRASQYRRRMPPSVLSLPLFPAAADPRVLRADGRRELREVVRRGGENRDPQRAGLRPDQNRVVSDELARPGEARVHQVSSRLVLFF